MSDTNYPAGFSGLDEGTFECEECHNHFTDDKIGDHENGWCVTCTAAYEAEEAGHHAAYFGQQNGPNRHILDLMKPTESVNR